MAFYQAEKEAGMVARWLDEVVIGENLCPFASLPRRQGRVDICVSDATDDDTLVTDFMTALGRILDTPAEQLETILLVVPNLYPDFFDYNDSLAMLETAIRLSGAEGEVQLASFHPGYCFDGEPEDDPANYTNRSPFPIYHLLRELSVEQALRGVDDPDAIPLRNIAYLRAMPPAKFAALFPERGTGK
ncbi:DUF1415 domain-containing protein [Spongiibacter taiwanensis]|uniref:DUF1415 domain-containing protein n=1 Tax=Spongiibacter taiwanensis TaxID=1748242 RepID=UPI0020352B21|nr:DUF1415 domain-containing protein [Spongiibacter taiwanensis]USA42480.1 DUF1415 domain-containing protein [Spongiibacter taiwanensis]